MSKDNTKCLKLGVHEITLLKWSVIRGTLLSKIPFVCEVFYVSNFSFVAKSKIWNAFDIVNQLWHFAYCVRRWKQFSYDWATKCMRFLTVELGLPVRQWKQTEFVNEAILEEK